MRQMIRGILDSITHAVGKVTRFDAKAGDEEIQDRESMSHYGFDSVPKSGAECMIIREGNHFVMIASEDRRYRIGLESGEVVLHDDLGSKVHLKRGGIIEVESTLRVDVKAATVRLGGLSLDTALGIVTGACACSVTGAIHPVSSLTAKATL